MKVLKLVLLFVSVILMPLGVKALSTISKLPPDVNITGIDEEKYNIEQEITEDKIIVNIKEKDGDLFYSWSFNKNKIKDNKINLNFELSFSNPKEKEIDMITKKNDDKTYLSFSHHGNLPSEATINVYVGKKYKNNEKLYLYYYNEETKEIEYVDKNLKVKDGYVEFSIKHCSIYFLTGAVVNNAKGNPKTLNRIIVALGLFIFALAAAMLFSKK